jgi:hypothetical protein
MSTQLVIIETNGTHRLGLAPNAGRILLLTPTEVKRFSRIFPIKSIVSFLDTRQEHHEPD